MSPFSAELALFRLICPPKWNTASNPHLSSEQESVHKNTVPNLDHLVVFVDIGQIGKEP
jgi:hypothetical protein